MREVDRRSKYDRRAFLKGAASTVPVVATATTAGFGIHDAWADDGVALAPATLKTLVKVARDIYPHDFLGDHYYIVAVKPWDDKAAKDPAVKALISDGVNRLDQDARERGDHGRGERRPEAQLQGVLHAFVVDRAQPARAAEARRAHRECEQRQQHDRTEPSHAEPEAQPEARQRRTPRTSGRARRRALDRGGRCRHG